MVVLSVDHGTRSGYSIFRDDKYIESGIVTLDSVTSLRKAHKEFFLIFSMYKPDVLVVEKVNVAGSKFGGTNIVKLAQLQAIVLLLADTFNCKVIEVNPMSMKKVITGNGKAEKREVAECIAKRWGLNPNHICVPVYYKKKDGVKTYLADESDAIALGTYYLEECKKGA